ncbi:MAG: Na-translocating system protein MpsC family protein [Planctomycetota bacterium]
MNKTKGQLEAEISEAIIKFEKEYMGRGPDETKTYIIGDMVLVRLRGVLTPAEKQLAKTDDNLKGRALIKQVRIELLEKAKMLLEKIIMDIFGEKVVSLHTDISTITGERIIIFILESAPQIECEEED